MFSAQTQTVEKQMLEILKNKRILAERIKSIIKSKRFLDLGYSLGGSIGSRMLNFAGFAWIARALEVNNYAYFTIIIALVATVTDLMNSGMNSSLIKYIAEFDGKGDRQKVNRLISTSIINVFVLSFVIGTVMVLGAHWFSKMYLGGNYVSLVVISILGVFSTFLYGVFMAILQGLQDFRWFSFAQIGFSALKLMLVGSIIHWVHPAIGALVFVFAITPVIVTAAGVFRLLKVGVRPETYDRQLLNETFSFGKWMMLWSLVSVARSRLDIYLLSPLSNSAQVSYFDVAQKFSSIIMMAISAYATVLNPRLAACTEIRYLRKEYKKAIFVSCAGSAALIASTIFLPTILRLMVGEKFSPSAMPLRILLFGLVPYIFTLATNSLLFAWGQSRVFFIAAAVGLTLNIGASWIMIPRYGANGSAFSALLVNISGLAISIIAFNRHAKKVGYRE
jgi:O-antigen/teichoic acid export membrane protein